MDFKSKLVAGLAQYAQITPKEDDNLAFFFAGFNSLCWLRLSILGWAELGKNWKKKNLEIDFLICHLHYSNSTSKTVLVVSIFIGNKANNFTLKC